VHWCGNNAQHNGLSVGAFCYGVLRMTRSEAKKNIAKTNKLRKNIERLSNRLWREPISGRGFKLCQDKLREATAELENGKAEHLEALKAVLAP